MLGKGDGNMGSELGSWGCCLAPHWRKQVVGGDKDNKAHKTCRAAAGGLSLKWLPGVGKGGWEERKGISCPAAEPHVTTCKVETPR